MGLPEIQRTGIVLLMGQVYPDSLHIPIEECVFYLSSYDEGRESAAKGRQMKRTLALERRVLEIVLM